jgi:hypothetical protein
MPVPQLTVYIFAVLPEDGSSFQPKHVLHVVNKWMSDHLLRCPESDNHRNGRQNRNNRLMLPKYATVTPAAQSIFRPPTELQPISR